MGTPATTRPQLGTIEESGFSDQSLSNGSPHRAIDTDTSPGGSGDESDEEFTYPGATEPPEVSTEDQTVTSQPHPSPAQLEALYAAASAGDLPLLQRLFRNALQVGEVGAFALANDASTRTGFTAMHAAASRGYLDIVKWLIEECGAMPDLEDREGETALHKAAFHGHLDIIQYLLPQRAEVHARDADGWTALHNACSKGYLDIVKFLCEQGGAASESNGIPGIDGRSKAGWTPLMNAASKGHLPVVRYLLTKQSANPLVRNNWGETACDVAASVFEIWICEVLQRAEAEQWRGTTVPYDPLAVHTTVPLILYENQRLDMRLKTLAVSGGRPKFSASGLGRQGRRAPFELKLPKRNELNGAKELAVSRNDVQLPYRDDPWTLPIPGTQTVEGAERSHFWLSDWTLDTTHPCVNAEDGWQYAHSFSDSDDQWVAEKRPQLERLLSGSGAVAIGLGGQVAGGHRRRSSASSSSSSSLARAAQTWVRRRRWVRVMRRRLDIPPLPFLEPDGSMYHLAGDGSLIPIIQDSASDYEYSEGQELGSMRSSVLSSAQDYVARARYLVGTQSQDDMESMVVSAVDARRAIAKLERATTELRQGILRDDDADRKTQAEVLLNAYSRDLGRRRLSAGAQGWLMSGQDDDSTENDGDSSDEEFHYPGASLVDTNRSSSRQSSITDYMNRPPSRTPTDLTPQLSQAPEFRVPTHETPQKLFTPKWTPPTPHSTQARWERDDAVLMCRECQRGFSFLTRRHHCRKCGRIFCDRCSAYRTVLNPSEIVLDPAIPDASSSANLLRVCRSCYDEVNAREVPSRLHGGGETSSMERTETDTDQLVVSRRIPRTQTSSQLSDLAECPVCNRNLGEIGDAHSQENHVKRCFEGGSDMPPQSAKYLVDTLPGDSVLIGVECVICLEEFVRGSEIARLSCLCTFHSACVSSWLQRGRNCPVHAR